MQILQNIYGSMAAFPLTRRIPSFWKKCLRVRGWELGLSTCLLQHPPSLCIWTWPWLASWWWLPSPCWCYCVVGDVIKLQITSTQLKWVHIDKKKINIYFSSLTQPTHRGGGCVKRQMKKNIWLVASVRDVYGIKCLVTPTRGFLPCSASIG